MLKRHLAPQMLQRLLKNELVDTKQDDEMTLGEKIKAFLVRGGGKNEEE
jgi:hypothetical protein